MKNETIDFGKECYEVNEAINKIIYYINKDFNLEQKLKIFYDSSQLSHIISLK